MTELVPNPRETIGGNNPPVALADDLALRFKSDLDLIAELLEAAKSVPKVIEDDETHGNVGELIKKMRDTELRLDKARNAEKKPYDDTVKAINGFFKVHIEKVEKEREPLKARTTDYSERKAAAERDRLRKEEEEKRAAAAEKMRLAQEAEDTAINAKQAANSARALAEEAAEAKKAASTEQEGAAADVAIAKAAHSEVRSRMMATAAEFAQRAKDGNPATADEKASAKAKYEGELQATKEAVDAAQTALAMARQKAIAAREEVERLARDRREAEAKERETTRATDAALADAVRETKAADRLAAKAESSDADLGRNRSIHGAVLTTQRQWKSEVQDRDLLDKAALWPFINEDAISAALYKWMMAQAPEKRVMAGAYIAQETVGSIR